MDSLEPYVVSIRLSEMYVVWSTKGPAWLFAEEEDAVLFCSIHSDYSFTKMEVTP
jgi:hypothetical protein